MILKSIKLNMLKSKQYSSSHLKSTIKKEGLNIKYTLSVVPNDTLNFLYEKFRKKYNSIITNQCKRYRISYLANIIQNYKGIRHKKGLPVHGQRTRTNASTQKRNAVELINVQRFFK